MKEKEVKELQYKLVARLSKKQPQIVSIDVKPKNWIHRLRMSLGISKKVINLELTAPTLSTRAEFTALISGIDLSDPEVLFKSENYERLIYGLSTLINNKKGYTTENIHKIIGGLDKEELEMVVDHVYELLNDDFFLTCLGLLKSRELPIMDSTFSDLSATSVNIGD